MLYIICSLNNVKILPVGCLFQTVQLSFLFTNSLLAVLFHSAQSLSFKLKRNTIRILANQCLRHNLGYKQKIIQFIRRNQVHFSSSNVSTDTTVIVKD